MDPFIAAIEQVALEKNIPKEKVIEIIEAALAAAYRKEYGHPDQHIRAHLDIKTGKAKMEEIKIVKDDKEVANKIFEISLSEAKKLTKRKDLKVGDEIAIPLPSKSEFGRIAAQTAKQVIIQKIKEAEKEILFKEFKEKEHQVVTGYVQSLEGRNVIINIGKINAILFPSEQIPGENYYIGQRLKVYVKEVIESERGPQVVVSRADPNLISKLFELEVPEVAAGSVIIKSIAREAGSRTKIAVTSNQEGLDPIGSCVGQRGTRVQAVLNEIGDEKIDIILYDSKPEQYITNALSPAKIVDVIVDKKEKRATVRVEEDQLSLAIGKNGQNVRLASNLTGYNIDIISTKEAS